ncbi:MAG: hypothetical protein IPI83_10990 [Sphingomonadales bacterium]|nr:hypothetical protein [Sphingomonadales bacterium]
MKTLRVAAIFVALTLMLGEAYRSWGAGRPIYAWIDDQFMGAALIAGAILMSRPSPRRHAFFAAAWAFNVGMLYPSFFGKALTLRAAIRGTSALGF